MEGAVTPENDRISSSDSKPIAKTWDGFASSASLHGVRFTSPGFSTRRRFTWSFLVVLFLCILIGSFTSTVIEYFRFEVNTVVVMVSERVVKFPAVTICNLNTLRKSKFLNASKSEENSKFLALARILSLADIDNKRENVSVPHLPGSGVRDTYKYFGHTIDRYEKGGMLLNCTYSQGQCNESYFKPVLTDLGLCFSFNHGRGFRKDSHENNVLTTTQPGNVFGLSIRLDAQTKDYILMPTHRFSTGWKVYIHDQNELPLAKDYGFAVSPGTHTLVGLVKRKVINLEPPYTTACRKDPLEGNIDYTLKACLRICQEKYIYNKCGCYPPINFINDTFRKHGTDCICPDACELTEYTPYLSYAYFPSDTYAVEIANHLVEAGIASSNQSAMTYFKKNIIELDIFFQQMNHVVIKQMPSKTLRDIYSELGGLLGASLGASFLTFIELLDFIYTRILLRLKRSRERQRTKVISLSEDRCSVK